MKILLPKVKHQAIYEIVQCIPLGMIMTYGQVAAAAGLPGHARLAGYALANLEGPLTGSDCKVPWQRVVNRHGEITYSLSRAGGDDLQRILLEQEGVVFNASGRIDLNQYRWIPDEVE